MSETPDRCEWCDRLGTPERPIIPNRGRRLCGSCSWAEIDDAGIEVTEVPAPGAIPRVRTVGGRQSRDASGLTYITPRSQNR